MTPTRAEFHVLLALMRGPRHGYGVMQDVEELSAGQLRLGPGTLYTAIKRLRASGLISECDADADRRRCYRLTRATAKVGAPIMQPTMTLEEIRDQSAAPLPGAMIHRFVLWRYSVIRVKR